MWWHLGSQEARWCPAAVLITRYSIPLHTAGGVPLCVPGGPVPEVRHRNLHTVNTRGLLPPASPAWPRWPGCPRVPGTVARSASAARAGTGAASSTRTSGSSGATSPSASTPAPASTPGQPSSSPHTSSLPAPAGTPSCRARPTSATWVTARAGGARAHQRGAGGARCGRAGAWPRCPGGRGLTLHWVTRGGRRYNWSHIVGLELYDHSRDQGEDTNLALDKRYAGVMDTCIKLLHGYVK